MKPKNTKTMEDQKLVKSCLHVEITDDGETTIVRVEFDDWQPIPDDAVLIKGPLYFNWGDNYNLYHDRDCRYYAKDLRQR